MHRLFVIALASLVGLSAPAFAQSVGNGPLTGPVNQGVMQDPAANASDGTDAYNQAPPSPDNTSLLIGGGVLLGGGILLAIAINNSNKNNPTSP